MFFTVIDVMLLAAVAVPLEPPYVNVTVTVASFSKRSQYYSVITELTFAEGSDEVMM